MKATRFDSEQQNRFSFLRSQGHPVLTAARAARATIGKGSRVASWARAAAEGRPLPFDQGEDFASSPTRA